MTGLVGMALLIQLTRNLPPAPGDFQDHEHFHPGIWWGFGDVGGNDYWRLKARIVGGEFVEEPKSEEYASAIGALSSAHPAFPAVEIVRAATLGGAAALGLAASLGSIEAGKRDRLTVVPFDGTGDPYEFLCGSPVQVYPLVDAPHEAGA